MNRLLSSLIIVISCTLLMSCSQKDHSETEIKTAVKDGYELVQNPETGRLQHAEDKPVELVLADSIEADLPYEVLVAGVRYLTTDDDGNIYLYDWQQNRIMSITKEGTFRWAAGQEGRGPGDFEKVYGMVLHENTLYVSNIQGSRLDLFSLDGEFMHSYNFRKEMNLVSPLGFTPDGKLIISKSISGKFGKTLFITELLSDSLHITESFAAVQSNDLDVPAGVNVSASLNSYENRIVSGSLIGYELRWFDYRGAITKKVTRDFDKIVRPGILTDGTSRFVMAFGQVGAPFIFPNGYFLVTATWPTNVDDPDEYVKKASVGNRAEVFYRNTTDIYDPEGNLLYSIEAEGYNPKQGRFLHQDDEGKLYTVSTDSGLTIFKFDLQ